MSADLISMHPISTDPPPRSGFSWSNSEAVWRLADVMRRAALREALKMIDEATYADEEQQRIDAINAALLDTTSHQLRYERIAAAEGRLAALATDAGWIAAAVAAAFRRGGIGE